MNTLTTSDILSAINSGAVDADLNSLIEAASRRLVSLGAATKAQAQASAFATIQVGDKVRLTDQVRPIRLQGREAEVVQINRTRFVIILDEPDARFSGRVTVPADLIEKV